MTPALSSIHQYQFTYQIWSTGTYSVTRFKDWAPGFNKSSAVAEMGDRLATIDMDRKVGDVPLFGGSSVPFNTMSLGPRPTALASGILIHSAIWPQQIWIENWGNVPLWGGGARSPSNTVSLGPSPTCMRSFILIRPTVWPQYTNVTWQDRQTGQTDNGLIA